MTQVHLPGRLTLGLSAHNPVIPIRGVVVLFTASTTARLGFHSAADCSVICVFTDDKFPWLGCCTCDFGLSHWMSWAMRSCSAPGGRGEKLSWEHMPPVQKEAKWLQRGLFHFFFLWWEMWVRLPSFSPIAWKRRVNQQEIHQLSINCPFHTTITITYWVSTLDTCTSQDVKKIVFSCKLKQKFSFFNLLKFWIFSPLLAQMKHS